MPGRITYNGINIDFKNEWVKFDDPLISNSSRRPAMSGIAQTVKFYEQDFISALLRNAPGQDQIQLRRFFQAVNDGRTFSLTRDIDLGTYISFGWNS